jgi:hypothetical protein
VLCSKVVDEEVGGVSWVIAQITPQQRSGYAMQQDTVIALPNPWSTLSDPLTEVLRRGAQQLLAQAVEAEVATLLALFTTWKVMSQISDAPKNSCFEIKGLRKWSWKIPL